MDWTPKQIIRTSVDANNSLKFHLDFSGLQEWIEPIKDLETVVATVVGTTQTGKSLLSNLIGYELDKSIESQIGDQIKGFESRASVETVTSGFWLSKPFVLRRTDGKQIAVLLLDTQSVFDGSISDENSEKIFWISLLISSCLIINLTSIQGFLPKLDQFLQYMVKGDTGCAESLIFMIRDWNKRNLFPNGLAGGKEYLAKIQEIKNSSEAIVAKRLLKKCFKQLNCYLMPGLGLKDEQEFNGSVSELGSNFVQCLQEVMDNSFDANNLIPKRINKKFITASELCLFIKVFVKLFNSNDKVNALEINTATTKTFDLILINKMKDQHLNELKKFIGSNDFVSRKCLEEHHNRLAEQLKKIFNQERKSDYPDIIEELNKTLDVYLKTSYEKSFEENENKRNVFIKNLLEEKKQLYGQQFEELTEDFGENKFMDSEELSDVTMSVRVYVLDQFIGCFAGEDESLFANYLDQLNKHFDMFDKEFSDENQKRILRSEQENNKSVEKSIDFYRNEMKQMLDSNQFLSDELFAKYENGIKAKARMEFHKNCIFGNKKFIKKFDEYFRQRITDLKYEFKELNLKKKERMIVDQEIDILDLINEFGQRVNQIPETYGRNDFKLKVTEISNQMKKQLLDTSVPKYLKELVTIEVEKQSSIAIKEFQLKQNRIKEQIEMEQIEMEQQKMDQLRMEQMKQDQLEKEWLEEKLKKKVHQELQEEVEFVEVIEEPVVQSKQSIDMELEVKANEYFKLYESTMKNSSDSAISLPEYRAIHEEVKSKVVNSFKSEASERTQSFGSFVGNLEEKMDNSYENSVKPFQIYSAIDCTELTDERPQTSVQLVDEFENSKLAQIIEVNSNGDYLLNEQLLHSILFKAKNCDNFALISNIGRQLSAKTFLMNCLKSFLETDNRKVWPKNCTLSYLDGFHTDMRTNNPGVYMWSKPFILEDDGQKTAVFLMDSSSVFNNRTELSNTKLVEDICGLFFKTSSTVIYLNDTLISPKEVQNLKSLVVKSLENTDMNKFQELLCVVRDWDTNRNKDKHYSLGQKGGQQYLDSLNRLTKHNLKDNFEAVHCSLLPPSGNYYKESIVEFNRLDNKFLDQLSILIRWKILNIDEIAFKKDEKTEVALKPMQLLKLFKTQINRMNGLINSTLDESDEYVQIYDSGESIEVLKRDQIRSYYSDDEDMSD